MEINNKTLKVVMLILGGIILVFTFGTALYCGITANSFLFGLEVFGKSIISVVLTFAIAQLLMLPYYIIKIMEEINEVEEKQNCFIVMLHNLFNNK